jgi:hypothetical protein
MVDLSEVRRISMLETPVLERLQALAREGEGGILEVGSYIGGSTIALVSGHMGRRQHAVIDCGGSYPDQPHLPSDDIIRDWRANVDRFGVADHVRMFEGWSTDSRAFRPAIVHSGSIGLFFFDGDGRCAEQFSVFAKYMRPGCVVVLDDYWVDPQFGQEKASIVKEWVDRMTLAGVLGDGELIGGTWFTTLRRKINFTHYRKEEGFAWMMPAPDPIDGLVRLFEDGKPLAHAQVSHADIREIGGGRYSHWDYPTGPRVLFSTSDNTDPNTNGRRYEIRASHEISTSISTTNASPFAHVIG